jgi:dsRNA-specific ribonuclease
MAKPDHRRKLLEQAWIGDAVLSLYARSKILREDGRQDSAKFTRMTSNQFLGALMDPAQAEAEIGRIYQAQGLDAAFAWIEQHLLPLFERQEENRRYRAAGKRTRINFTASRKDCAARRAAEAGLFNS